MADTKNLPAPAALKDRFKAGSIPLQSDFADLIDMAAAGASATGVASGQNGNPGLGMRLSADGKLEPDVDSHDYTGRQTGVLPLKVDTSTNALVVDLHLGLEVGSDGLSVMPSKSIVVDNAGVSVAADIIANAAAGAKAVGAYTGQDDKPGLGMQLSSNGKLELKVSTFNYGTAVGFMPVSVNTATNAPVIDLSYGMTATDSGLSIAPGKGIKVDSNGVRVDMAYVVPSGTIVMFWGHAVPEGWVVCNGSNGTPDLRDRFIKGGSGVGTTPKTGGQVSVNFTPSGTITIDKHTLTVNEMPSHSHSIVAGVHYGTQGSSGRWTSLLGLTWPESYVEASVNALGSSGGGAGHNHTGSFKGSSQTIKTEPQYHILVFIMKT